MTFLPPPPNPPAPQVGPPKLGPSWFKRGWVLAIAALVVGVGIGSAGGKTKVRDVAGPITTATATATATVTTTIQPTKVVATHTVQVRVTFTPAAVNQFSDGTYLVGKDIPPGLYKTDGSGGCYWERMSSLSGGLDSIIANDNISGPTTVQIAATDAAFKTSGGCTWSRVG
jgi:hypothetical protein